MIDALRRTPALRNAALIGPAVAVIGFFMIVPLCLMIYISFLERSMYGGVHWGSYTPEAYVRFLFERNLDGSLALNFDYIEIFARSFWLSISTTVLALLVGFPTALYMAVQPERYRNLLIFLVTIPFWTNLLVRNYAWILLLRDGGIINGTLMRVGLISEPIPLLYNDFAVGVGLTYSFLPFMVLPIYASLEKLDFRLVEAAHDLYANRRRALTRVVLPLARPGLIAGAILVFVPCLGSYVTPALLGGAKALMIGNLIQLQFGEARNWPFGAALAFALLAIVLLALVFYALRVRREPEARA
jgi:spermidine/putrescine transport system permease protein